MHYLGYLQVLSRDIQLYFFEFYCKKPTPTVYNPKQKNLIALRKTMRL